MKVSAKSVILEILSANQGPVPVRHLVRAAAVFDVAENSVRVAIVRLRAEGLVESTERGLYQLGPAAQPVHHRIAAYRHTHERMCAWDGSWIGVFTADLSRTDRPALRRRSQALRLAGFRKLRPGLHIRPKNLTGGLESVRGVLHELGLDPSALLFRITDLAPDEEAAARGLWDVKAMRAVYRDMREQLEESTARMKELTQEEAIREAFLLGREAIRIVVLDPLLPEPLVPAAERDALAQAAARYQDEGIALWREFLGPFDA